jgi:hypothetical protein
MSRMGKKWTTIKKELEPIGLDSEALWALLGVFSLTLIFQLIERGYV